MKEVNELVICKENYKTTDEFKNAIRDAIMLLLNAGYIMTVDYNEKALGIVIIRYDYSDESYGRRYPCWLLPEEEETVVYKED